MLGRVTHDSFNHFSLTLLNQKVTIQNRRSATSATAECSSVIFACTTRLLNNLEGFLHRRIFNKPFYISHVYLLLCSLTKQSINLTIWMDWYPLLWYMQAQYGFKMNHWRTLCNSCLTALSRVNVRLNVMLSCHQRKEAMLPWLIKLICSIHE